MLKTIILILLVLWLLGFVFEILGGLVHILLIVALGLFIYNQLKKRDT
ncbi:lmo0937 family membrane protein [Lacticigenium naphthae]